MFPFRFSSWIVLFLIPGTVFAEEPLSKGITVPDVFKKFTPQGKDDLKVIEDHVKMLVKKVTPAVVDVRVIGGGEGSGVIVREDGIILTAAHVMGAPDRNVQIITSEGKQLKGKTLGCFGLAFDVGMIKIVGEGKYPYVEKGKSDDLEKGEWCMTLGHPGGWKPKRPPVLRLGRVLEHSNFVVRTDCALVGGDSGGPLFDMAGKVIGIHSRIEGNVTSNVHIPIDLFQECWDSLLAGEAWTGPQFTTMPYFGVETDIETKPMKITSVAAESPAEKAGIKVNDVLLSFDDRKVPYFPMLLGRLAKKAADDEVPVVVKRGEETLTLKVQLTKAPGKKKN